MERQILCLRIVLRGLTFGMLFFIILLTYGQSSRLIDCRRKEAPSQRDEHGYDFQYSAFLDL